MSLTKHSLRSWSVPAAIVLVASAAIIGVHAGVVQLSSKPSRDFLVIVVAMEVLVLGWILVLSRWRANGRLMAMTAFVAAQAILCQMVTLDGFHGDGRPIWRWRWTPSPQSAARWEERRVLTSSPASREIDLTVTTADYPAFRGHDRTGRAAGPPLSTDWKTHPPRLLWKRPIGAGWSSFACVGDYCVTQEQRGEHEATVCYELRTGRELWTHLEPARFYELTSGEGPRATPTIHKGRVYSLGATGILNCLDGASGQPLWTIDILADNSAPNRLFGVTNSPLVADGMVIVNPGGTGSSLAAYDLKMGRRRWRAGNAGASYSSPQPARLCGVDQVLDFNADGLFAHDLVSGEVLWSVPWISNPEERNNVCQPVVCPAAAGDPDGVFIASGYGMGCAVFEVRKQEQHFVVDERWRNRHLKAKFSSVVVHQGYAYGLDDAILTCVEVSSGRRCWKGGRYGYGQLLLAGSLLLIQLESGEVALVDASPIAFGEWSRFTALANRTWNHPALAGRYLLVRNDREAACYELPVRAAGVP